MFKQAVKYDAKLRLSLAGPSGSGKTYTALTLATALAEGKPIALIDTERGSASKYADLFSFDVMELDSFHPDKFVAGIREAEQEGYSVLVIDSLSHAWNGTGGLLELVEAITKRSQSKNSFTAWSEATPIQNRLIEAITRANLHIICTMRSKQEYALEKDERTGKTTPKKVGMAPIQRDGMEYEFDVVVDMDIDNTMIVQKSRCPALSGQVISKPDGKVAFVLRDWLKGATPLPAVVVPEQQNGNGHKDARPESTGGHVHTYKSIYDLGKNRKEWNTPEAFTAFCSAVLNRVVVQKDVVKLSQDDLAALYAALTEEQPATGGK